MKYLLCLLFLCAPYFAQALERCEPNVDSCGFYLCKEKEHQCGPKGYPLGFGFKFCQIFLNTEQNYSPAAHAWLRRVRVCLMEEFLKTDDENPSRTCGQVKSEGFRSHLGCYVNTGFCQLSPLDHFQITWAMRSSARYVEVLQDAQRIVKACASEILK